MCILSIQTTLILMIAGMAVLMDFLMEKVLNLWIYWGLAAGIFNQIFQYGGRGIPRFLAGVLLPFVLLLPLFYFRMLGAGDIKVLSVLGGVLGWQIIFRVMVCSFLVGAVLSFAFLISCKNFKERISYFFQYWYMYYKTGNVQPYRKKGRQAENFHFTVPILLGVMLYVGGVY